MNMHRILARAAAPVAFLAFHPSAARADDNPPPPSSISGKPVHIGARSCAFAGRTSWALRELGAHADFEHVEVALGAARPAWLREINPCGGTVPVILDARGARVEGNSAALVAWLFERSATAPPTPASARAVADEFDRTTLGALYAMLRTDAPPGSRAWHDARARVEAALDAIEARFVASSSAGPYFLGDALSLADIAIFSVLHRFKASLREFRAYELISAQRTPRLARALAACSARPAFEESQPTPAEVVQFYSSDTTYNPNRKSEALDAWVGRMLAGSQLAP